MSAKMTLDTGEFDRTMQKYMSLSKKTIAEVVNKKAYMIAVGAMQFTKLANRAEINAFARNWKRSAATIIKGFKLKKPFDKKEYQKKLGKLRRRSISYLRSGWIPAIRMLGRAAKMPTRVPGARMKGRPKGYATWANNKNWSPVATITNATGYKKGQAEALEKYGRPALAKAFIAEMAAMKVYIENKLKKTARKSGIRRGG